MDTVRGHSPLANVLEDVARERARQDAKWGVQNHPDGTLPVSNFFAAEWARAQCEVRFKKGAGTWADVLREEFAEAMAAEGADLREELVQVAAVAVAWVEAIDRRKP